MDVRIALRGSQEDGARPTAGSVRRDSIASAQRALGSSGAGSPWSWQPSNLSFPISGRTEYGPECLPWEGEDKATEAQLVVDMAGANATIDGPTKQMGLVQLMASRQTP